MTFGDLVPIALLIGFLAARALIALCMEKWAINQEGSGPPWFVLAFMFMLLMALLLAFHRMYLKLSRKPFSFNVRHGIAQLK